MTDLREFECFLKLQLYLWGELPIIEIIRNSLLFIDSAWTFTGKQSEFLSCTQFKFFFVQAFFNKESLGILLLLFLYKQEK